MTLVHQNTPENMTATNTDETKWTEFKWNNESFFFTIPTKNIELYRHFTTWNSVLDIFKLTWQKMWMSTRHLESFLHVNQGEKKYISSQPPSTSLHRKTRWWTRCRWDSHAVVIVCVLWQWYKEQDESLGVSHWFPSCQNCSAVEKWQEHSSSHWSFV